jgi:hypothetical protein
MDEKNNYKFRLAESKVRKGKRLSAVVTGLFETRIPTDKLVRKNVRTGENQRIGFGHMGGFPAQIVVRSIANIRIEKSK